MKFLTLLLLLPAASMAFAPLASVSRATATLRNELDDACTKVVDTTEKYIGKADDLVVERAMRVANHLPILVTLKALADKAGMSVSQSGIVAAPESFAGVAGALTVPTWCNNVFAVAVIAQLASIVRSALAADKDELDQATITAGAVSNVAVARMVGSGNPLRDTVIAAALSSYAMRKGGAGGDVTIGNVSTQIISAMTTIVAALGVASAILDKIPVVNEVSGLSSIVGVLIMYALNNRADNGTARKAINGGILLGMLVNTVKGGVSLALDIPSIVGNIGLVGLAYVTYQAVNGARKAIMD